MKSDLVGFGRLSLRVMQSGALLTLLQASCSGETTETSDASVDAHFDMSSEMGATEEQSTPQDVGTPEEPAIDGPVVDACVPGGERKPCGAYYTGCPTTGICYERFGFVCGCVECRLELETTSCSWTLEGQELKLGWSRVEQIDNEGGARVLSVFADADCRGLDGYFFVATGLHLTITLCPGSCQSHQNGGAMFSLLRYGCPPT